jgi:hypothetical protein
MVQGLSAPSQVAVTCAGPHREGIFGGSMLQLALFFVIAGVPIFLFLRRVRALKLTRGYSLVLTIPIVLGLWIVINLIVDIGRL